MTGELSYTSQKVGNIEIVEYDSKSAIFKKILWYGCRLYDYKKNASNFTLFFNVGWRNVVFYKFISYFSLYLLKEHFSLFFESRKEPQPETLLRIKANTSLYKIGQGPTGQGGT